MAKLFFSGVTFAKPVGGMEKIAVLEDEFDSGIVDFTGAQFSGSQVLFEGAKFEAGIVDLSQVSD
jgi:hypothetical protein